MQRSGEHDEQAAVGESDSDGVTTVSIYGECHLYTHVRRRLLAGIAEYDSVYIEGVKESQRSLKRPFEALVLFGLSLIGRVYGVLAWIIHRIHPRGTGYRTIIESCGQETNVHNGFGATTAGMYRSTAVWIRYPAIVLGTLIAGLFFGGGVGIVGGVFNMSGVALPIRTVVVVAGVSGALMDIGVVIVLASASDRDDLMADRVDADIGAGEGANVAILCGAHHVDGIAERLGDRGYQVNVVEDRGAIRQTVAIIRSVLETARRSLSLRSRS